MKRQVRLGVFETNSSMTHALTMCTDDEYQKWIKGELYWNRYNWRHDGDFITIEEAEEDFKFDKYHHTDFDEYRHDEGILTHDEFNDYDYVPYETFEDTHTTSSGETIHAFGYYGYDG